MTLPIVEASLRRYSSSSLTITDSSQLNCTSHRLLHKRISLFGQLWPLTASREYLAFGVQVLWALAAYAKHHLTQP